MLVTVNGPPWRRPNGQWVPHGGTFTATPAEQADIKKHAVFCRRYGLAWNTQPATAEQHIDGGVGASAPAAAQQEQGRQSLQWLLQITPQAYLKRHPDGKHAALARQVIEEEGQRAAALNAAAHPE